MNAMRHNVFRKQKRCPYLFIAVIPADLSDIVNITPVKNTDNQKICALLVVYCPDVNIP